MGIGGGSEVLGIRARKSVWIDRKADEKVVLALLQLDNAIGEQQRCADITLPLALLSHEITEHYTYKFILDVMIACVVAINLDPRYYC